MKSTREPGRIQLSDEFAIKLRRAAPGQELPNLEPRGIIDVKGKGQMMTYWVT